MNERHQRDLAVRLPEPLGLLESQAVRFSRYLADAIYLCASGRLDRRHRARRPSRRRARDVRPERPDRSARSDDSSHVIRGRA